MLGVILAMALGLGDFEDASEATAAMRAMPRDVRVLIDRRLGCNHWWGEPVDRKSRDPAARGRARQIDEALRELRCDTVEREEVRLARRYARSPAILKALRETRDWQP